MGRLNIPLVYENKQSFERSLGISLIIFGEGWRRKLEKYQGQTALSIL